VLPSSRHCVDGVEVVVMIFRTGSSDKRSPTSPMTVGAALSVVWVTPASSTNEREAPSARAGRKRSFMIAARGSVL
jgi:hypothetical protein